MIKHNLMIFFSSLTLAFCLPAFAETKFFNFDDGTLQGWTNTTTIENYIPHNTSEESYSGRCIAYSPDHVIIEENFDDRDNDTDVKILTSPEFILTSNSTISIETLGGTGSVDTPLWSNINDLPDTASDSGFMGAALRRVSDGEYLLFSRRPAPGQSNRDISWLSIGWNPEEITENLIQSNDTYVIDIIDTYSGSWGWIAIDSITLENIIIPGQTSIEFLTQPKDALLPENSIVELNVSVYSANQDITYKWYKHGSGTIISDSSSFTTQITASSEGFYYCIISDGYQQVISNLAQLAISNCTEDMPADINKDCIVDLKDFIIFAGQWLQTVMARPEYLPFEQIYNDFLDSSSNTVLVAAHRGDWKHAPENSLPAVQGCINMGIAFAEIDVRKTSDGHLVLMHDSTVDRTTNGSGSVSSLTLEQIKSLRLKNSDGTLSDCQIPTLTEVMNLAKGKIMINLDKAWSIRNECLQVLIDTNTVGQALFKSSGNAETLRQEIANLNCDINFMHIIECTGTDSPSAESIINSINILHPDAVEINFNNDAHPIMQKENIDKIRAMGTRLWSNSLWAGRLSGGHPDSNTETWDWLTSRGTTIIQTDSPAMLRDHLK